MWACAGSRSSKWSIGWATGTREYCHKIVMKAWSPLKLCSTATINMCLIVWVKTWADLAELCVASWSVVRHGFAGVVVYALAFRGKALTPFVTQIQAPSATKAVQKCCQAITCVLIAEFCSMRPRKGTIQLLENCCLLPL